MTKAKIIDRLNQDANYYREEIAFLERYIPESYRMEDENPANAALRLWLKLKGIEVK